MTRRPTYCLFFDHHTMPSCPDVGANFRADEFAEQVKLAGVDFLGFHARCNMGMAYYDTKIGIRHPSLKFDLFGRLAEACTKRDIALSAYFNAGLSGEEAHRHREWAVVSPDGRLYREGFDRSFEPFTDLAAFNRRMCYNSGYGDHLISMIEEVARRYPVAGFFIDCFDPHPCIGIECMREMKANGVDWRDERQAHAFARFSRDRLMNRIAEAAKAIKPESLIYFNGVEYGNQSAAGTYLECECLPTGFWGYEVLPVRARYMRTLGKPVINMTGRFHMAWGDFGGIRKPAGVKYDCVYGLANGMRPNIGCHAHPRGDINQAVFKLVREVYADLRRHEPWYADAVPVVDLAVVTPTGCADPSESASVRGATRLLCELRQQFDVVDLQSAWDSYRMLVLPDDVRLDDEVSLRIRKHLDAGKPILASGRSGMNPDGTQFVNREWGVSYRGECPFHPAYMAVEAAWAEGLPDMPMALYGKCLELDPKDGTEVAACIVAPYYNANWDGEHGLCYTPPDKVTAWPAAVMARQVAHLASPIFESYYNEAAPFHRELVAKLLWRLFPNPLITNDNLPSYARLMVTAQPGKMLVHILSYLPEKRGRSMQIIEEPIELRDVSFRMRVGDARVEQVYTAPDRTALAHEMADGYIRIHVPRVNGYCLVVVNVVEEERKALPC